MVRIYHAKGRLAIEIETDNWRTNIIRRITRSGNYDVLLEITPKKDGDLYEKGFTEGELVYEEISREEWLSLKREFERKRAIDTLAERWYKQMSRDKWADC